jgi:multidrug/hemolysin transport system permease protein
MADLSENMRVAAALTERGIRIFFRDRSSVLFSTLSVLIVLVLYIAILRSSIVSGFEGYPGAAAMSDAWIIAGLAGIVPVSSSVAAMGLIIKDRHTGALDDLRSAPVSSFSITAGYLLSTFVIGLVMTFVFLILGEAFMFASGHGFGAISMLQAAVLMVPSVFSSCAFVFLVTALLRSKAAFDGFAAVLNVLIGFLTGTFVPIGYFSKGVQSVLTFVPATHSAAVARDILGTPALDAAFSAFGEVREHRDLLGFDLYIGDWMVSPVFSISYLIGTGAVFFIIAGLLMRRQ